MQVGADYVFQQRDILEHTLHRHEPPVSADPIRIVRDDGDVVVVDKPASIPVCTVMVRPLPAVSENEELSVSCRCTRAGGTDTTR